MLLVVKYQAVDVQSTVYMYDIEIKELHHLWKDIIQDSEMEQDQPHNTDKDT